LLSDLFVIPLFPSSPPLGCRRRRAALFSELLVPIFSLLLFDLLDVSCDCILKLGAAI
jgi:hypothetical protein